MLDGDAAAQGFDQADGGGEFLATELDDGAFDGEFGVLGGGDFDCELSNPATHSDSSTSGPTSSREQVCMRWWWDCGVFSVFLSLRVVSTEG